MSMLHCQAGSVTDRVFLQKLQTMDLIMNRELTGQSIGSRRSKTEGSSVEWKDYTEYSAGDDLRRVDWNLYARFGKLYTRHFIG